MAATLITFERVRPPAIGAALDSEILDMVAGDQPLDAVLDAIAGVVERQIPGIRCSLVFTPRRKNTAANLTHVEQEIWNAGLLALAHNVSAASGAPHSTRRSVKVRSRGRKTIGDLTLGYSTTRPLDPGQTRAIETAIRLASIAVEHRELHSDLNRQATTDRATGLPNRYAFEDRLARFVRSSKAVEPAAVVWIGFERFNDIHESIGYRTKDALLRSVGQRITAVLSAGEWLARVGGNDFAVLCEGARAEAASECAERVLRSLETAFKVHGYEFYLAPRVGIALYPDHGLNAAALQQKAANALWRPKDGSGAKYAFYQPDRPSDIRQRLQTENDLRHAVENRELELFYQPQVDLDGRLAGMEALIRWNHPKRGMLSPDKFIPLAEETGLIVPIGGWVIREACRQCAEWNKLLESPIKVAVNISALQLYFSDLPEIIAASLQEAGLPANCFEIELTETAVMRDDDEAAKALQKLRDLGVTVAIDDFGTGYSSLSYLQKLPVDLLKIDRSFFKHIDAATPAAVVRGITALGHNLGLRVIAEGIETKEQMESLRALGVDIAQGFLIGRPMPSGKAFDWIITDGKSPARSLEQTRQGVANTQSRTQPKSDRGHLAA